MEVEVIGGGIAVFWGRLELGIIITIGAGFWCVSQSLIPPSYKTVFYASILLILWCGVLIYIT